LNEVVPDRVRVAVALTTQQVDLHHMEWIEIRVAIAKAAREQWVVAEWVGRPGDLKTHVTRVLAKLGVSDRVQAVIAAFTTGIARPGDGMPPT
jgi:hypothetical protein